jgi:hypothetical protein
VNRVLWWILGGVVAAIAVATVVVGVSSMPSDEDVAAYQHGYNASEYDYQHGGAARLQAGLSVDGLCIGVSEDAVARHTFPANDNGDFYKGCLAALGVAQVGLHGTDLATVSAAAIGGLLQRVSLAGNQHEVQTGFGEKLRKLGADTLRAPGDERPRPVLRGIDHRADERLCGRVHDQHVDLGPARDVGGHRSQ